MTEKTLKEANEILKKIERIRQLRSWIFHNLYIKKNEKDYDSMYLSWVDNENGGLKNTIVNWCDNEIKRLQSRFDEL